MTKEKYTQRETSLEDAISEAFSVITELGEEMREAYDNTPESLQQSGAGEARGEAADALEGINEATVPDCLSEEKVTYPVPNRTARQASHLPRRERRDDACLIFDACIERLQEIADDEKRTEELRDYATELCQEIESAKDDAEGVEFPGMRG